MTYLNPELSYLLDLGFVQLQSEIETIELAQRLRRNAMDMNRVDIDLDNYQIFLVV